jgi:hypothetical protein
MNEWTSANSLKVRVKNVFKGKVNGPQLNGNFILKKSVILDDGLRTT